MLGSLQIRDNFATVQPPKRPLRWFRASCSLERDPASAANDLYENESFARIQLIQAFLASLEMHLENRICVGQITDGVYRDTGAAIDDADGLVDYARSIKGVEIGVLIEERTGSIKASLRAKDPKYRVDQIAQVFLEEGTLVQRA